MRGARRRNNPVRGQLGMLKSSLHGHKNDLKAVSPPVFTRIPFNTITVEEQLHTAAAPALQSGVAPTGVRTVHQIIEALKSQVNLSVNSNPSVTGASLTIKVIRIDLWSMSASSSILPPTIRGKFYGMVQQTVGAGTITVNPLKVLENVGVQGSNAAVVSYSWPRDNADMPLTETTVNPIFSYDGSDNSQSIFARYHLHWNTTDDSQVVSFEL